MSLSTVSRAWRSDTRRQGHRRTSAHQQNPYLLLCARANRRSTARPLQNSLHQGTRVWPNCQTPTPSGRRSSSCPLMDPVLTEQHRSPHSLKNTSNGNSKVIKQVYGHTVVTCLDIRKKQSQYQTSTETSAVENMKQKISRYYQYNSSYEAY